MMNQLLFTTHTEKVSCLLIDKVLPTNTRESYKSRAKRGLIYLADNEIVCFGTIGSVDGTAFGNSSANSGACFPSLENKLARTGNTKRNTPRNHCSHVRMITKAIHLISVD